MRRFLSIALMLIGFLAVGLSSSQSLAQSTVETEVSAAEDALIKAISDRDWPTVLSMMTPDHIVVTPYLPGQANMQTVMDAVTSGDFTEQYLGDRQVVELGEGVALLKQEKLYGGKMNGVDLPPKVRLSAIWVKVDGEWKQRYYQETTVLDRQ